MVRYLLSLLVISFTSGVSRADEPPLRIGIIQSLTGIAAEDGKTIVQALELAKEHVQQKSGIPVVLTIEDDKSNPRDSVTSYKKLHGQGNKVVIGSTWDFLTNSISDLAERDRTILFNASCYYEALNEKQLDYLFVNSQTPRDEIAPLRQFLSREKPRRAVLLYANNRWGETQRDEMLKLLDTAGVQVVLQDATARNDQNEWSQLAPKIKQLAPDALLLALNRSDLELLLRRLAEIGFAAPTFTSKNAFDALRYTSSLKLFEGVCFPYPLRQLQNDKRFVEEYQARYKESPRVYADSAYDALFIIAEAEARSRRTGAQLKETLKETTYRGVAGDYRYSPEQSLSTGKADLVCVKNGKAEAQ